MTIAELNANRAGYEVLLEEMKVRLHELKEHTSHLAHVDCPDKDNVDEMLLAIFLRTKRHVESVELLDFSRDSLLIVRSLMEGMMLMRWMRKDTEVSVDEERVLKYSGLSWVMLKRTLDSLGVEADPQAVQLVDSILHNSSGLLKAHEYNSADLGFQLDSDFFLERLTGFKSIRDVFKGLGETVLYEKAYGPMSDYHHWNSMMLGHRRSSSGQVTLDSTTYMESRLIVRLCFIGLCVSAIDVCRHFGRQEEDDLRLVLGAFNQRYVL